MKRGGSHASKGTSKPGTTVGDRDLDLLEEQGAHAEPASGLSSAIGAGPGVFTHQLLSVLAVECPLFYGSCCASGNVSSSRERRSSGRELRTRAAGVGQGTPMCSGQGAWAEQLTAFHRDTEPLRGWQFLDHPARAPCLPAAKSFAS